MRLFKLLYVDILECSDGTYYTGITNCPDRRLLIHNRDFNTDSYTSSRRPVEMVFCEGFTNYNLAIEWETRIKKWSRKKKETLIQSKWENLKEAAACKNKSSWCW
jgi:putative endonuclease